MKLELITPIPNELLQTRLTEEWDFENPMMQVNLETLC